MIATRDARPIVARHLEAAGVPPRFRDNRLEGFQAREGTKAALAAAQRLVGDPARDRGLVLSGPPGTGKTHLAVGILAARADAWLTAYPVAVEEPTPRDVRVRPNLAQRFVVVPTLLDRIRTGIEYHDSDDPLPGLMAADLLVLDDLGREKSTDWVLERLYVLVNERYNQQRPTIVTTNYTPDALADRGYEAIVSRLIAGAELVRLTGSDFRSGGRP